MYFWIKFFHIAAMAVWFSGLFFLPRVFVAHPKDGEHAEEHARFNAIAKSLYFGVMTPAAVVTVFLGIVLILVYGFSGAWLPAKLLLVTLAVLLHVYLGGMLVDMRRGQVRRHVMVCKLLNWTPLPLLLAIAALAAMKPGALPILGGV